MIWNQVAPFHIQVSTTLNLLQLQFIKMVRPTRRCRNWSKAITSSSTKLRPLTMYSRKYRGTLIRRIKYANWRQIVMTSSTKKKCLSCRMPPSKAIYQKVAVIFMITSKDSCHVMKAIIELSMMELMLASLYQTCITCWNMRSKPECSDYPVVSKTKLNVRWQVERQPAWKANLTSTR